ncbi:MULTISPECIES: ferritin-like domain-containing protein [Actinoalloteichus]|uniref:DUF4439 family protein n=1 Tax=Actinoalloteichus fjordicus TaxID=1612552 RepID=A0AAC9L9P7_9PSEU|nr:MULTISPECIES: ferritin-like domain-containing protein [Actinoalloteichus]APU13908.1 putative DUF4439 family protein [Actinoalloteichus fjordicus]APU19854.1 putative DUF4439 family protein [Actinoalloteichus sp. GBA129-24]
MIDRRSGSTETADSSGDPDTSGAETTGSAEPGLGGSIGDAVDAVQTALAAEHAAVWAHHLAAAFRDEEVAEALAEGTRTHTVRRDTLEDALRAEGVDPVPTEAAYQSPEQVTDHATAVAMLIHAETDCAGAWRALLEHAEQPGVRATSVAALTDAAVRAVRWRRAAGQNPLTVTFPGSPDSA